MTVREPNLVGMNVARRIEVGLILALVAGGFAIAAAGTVAAFAGVGMPAGVGAALGMVGTVLGWAKVLVAAALVVGVARSREDG